MYSVDCGLADSWTCIKTNFTAGMLCSLLTHCMCNSGQSNQRLMLESQRSCKHLQDLWETSMVSQWVWLYSMKPMWVLRYCK